MEALRIQLVETAKTAYQEGLFRGTSGNLSLFDRERGLMLITPTGARYETMEPVDVVAMTLDGAIIGEGKPSSEWQMHACVYAQLPEVGAIVHTHSPYATAFAVARQSIPVTLIELVYFLGGSVDCADFAIPGTRAVGEGVIPLLQNGKGGCLLANHGVLAVGKDLPQALLRAEYIEDGAKITILAKSLGEPVVLHDNIIS